MELQLPKPIERYVHAENTGDVDSVAECFSPYATVRDEGHYYEGLPAIKAWKARSAGKHEHRVTPLAISVADGIATLRARLSGRFPGSPITANLLFVLVDDQIASLRISI